jgi:uncharacterized protein (DUF58 family)
MRTHTQHSSDQFPAMVDPAVIMRIKDLQLRAKTVVEGFYNGLHRSPYHGFSVEFSEYRPYTLGDDPRHVDWKLRARTDRLYIKRFEDETNRRAHLVVDLSQSMNYGSLAYPKIEYARTLAATLAYYLTLQRDNVGLFTFDDAVIDYLPARFRHGHFRRLLMCLERPTQGRATDLIGPLDQVASLLKKRGLVLIISDLLAPVEALRTRFGYLRSRGHEVLLWRVLDPAEIEFPFGNAAMFHDMESRREFYVDPATARTEYQRKFRDHDTRVQMICGQLGIDYRILSTNQPLELALFELLSVQCKRGKRIHRVRQYRGAS